MFSETEISRFWSRVDRRGPDECWQWTGATDSHGYGQLTIHNRHVGAHRLAYTFTVGSIPAGLCICHTCDNPPCCNPAHLFIGTMSDNLRDCAQKGRNGAQSHPERRPRGDRSGARLHPERMPRGDHHGSHIHPDRVACGERAGSAKLTANDVRAIRQEAKHISQRQLAIKYGVTHSAIWRIVHHHNWKHIQP